MLLGFFFFVCSTLGEFKQTWFVWKITPIFLIYPEYYIIFQTHFKSRIKDMEYCGEPAMLLLYVTSREKWK